MNIDRNEQPEEQPEVEQAPDSSGLIEQLRETDHNRAAYENLTIESLTEAVNETLGEIDREPPLAEEVREAIAEEDRINAEREDYGLNVEGDVDFEEVREEEPIARPTIRPAPTTSRRRVVSIDTANLPDGISAADAVRIYQETGMYGVSNSSTPTNETTLDDLVKLIGPEKESKEEVKEEEAPLLTPEEIRQIKAERRVYHALQLGKKRENYIKDVTITKDDLIIESRDSVFMFFHTEMEGEHLIRNSLTSYAGRRGANKILQIMSNEFIFDKNMKYVYVDHSNTFKKRGLRDGTRIYNNQVPPKVNRSSGDKVTFFIIDKKAFIESSGRVIKVKRRNNVSYHRIMEFKKLYVDIFNKANNFLIWMKTNIEQVHLKEDYDIMYSISGTINVTNRFSLILKYKDITISNSVEMEHYLGDMFVKSEGRHLYSGRENQSSLEGSIAGMRSTFTPGDAIMSYQHSHLSSAMVSFGGFCTGGENYGHGTGYMTDMELQSHIIKLSQFITWESLEGGPHYRMEDVNIYGNVLRIKSVNIGDRRSLRDNYVKAIVDEINTTKEKFSAFSDCFTLINIDRGLRFVIDYNMFFEKFMEVIPNERLKIINQVHGEVHCIYNSVNNTFHRISDPDLINGASIIRKARDSMSALIPIYMDGKYHRPRLIEVNADQLLEGIRFCVEPNFMKEVAQLILYHLTNKLEEYGNTSESKRREEDISCL